MALMDARPSFPHRTDPPTWLAGHGVGDLLRFAGPVARHARRTRAWATALQAARRRGGDDVPFPVLLQLIPTEACNLACRMCIQWGDRGHYRGHRADVDEAPLASLVALVRETAHLPSLLSIYGGEPFLHPGVGALLHELLATDRDVVFSTNGTLLGPHVARLGRLRRAIYMVSIDGDEERNDRIRGDGVYARVKQNLALLRESCLDQTGARPLVFLNCAVSEHWRRGDVERARAAGRDLGAVNVNFTLRWFVTEAMGRRYERQLEESFGVRASECWRSFLWEPGAFDAEGLGRELGRLLRDPRSFLSLPFPSVVPAGVSSAPAFARFFRDPTFTFGRERCSYPAYACRIQANGDMIFCPGYRDLIAGNAFRDGFGPVFNGAPARRLRRFLRDDRFAVCSRCCGLYLASSRE